LLPQPIRSAAALVMACFVAAGLENVHRDALDDGVAVGGAVSGNGEGERRR
jgi:hypothetical protein